LPAEIFDVTSTGESGARSVPIYRIASIWRGETEELVELQPYTQPEVLASRHLHHPPILYLLVCMML
jgi:hypothetical protein